MEQNRASGATVEPQTQQRGVASDVPSARPHDERPHALGQIGRVVDRRLEQPGDRDRHGLLGGLMLAEGLERLGPDPRGPVRLGAREQLEGVAEPPLPGKGFGAHLDRDLRVQERRVVEVPGVEGHERPAQRRVEIAPVPDAVEDAHGAALVIGEELGVERRLGRGVQGHVLGHERPRRLREARLPRRARREGHGGRTQGPGKVERTRSNHCQLPYRPGIEERPLLFPQSRVTVERSVDDFLHGWATAIKKVGDDLAGSMP